jgi:ABC-type multidrug transport system fused ATPase/permease subunit
MSRRDSLIAVPQIIEFDTPETLLAKDSVFRSLASEAKLVDDL